MSSIDLQQQQQKVDENTISNCGNSKEFCIAALLVPPVAPLDNDDDKTPTIKNHKAEVGPFDKDDNDVSAVISVNHPSEIQIQHISANSIQSKESEVVMKAINNDDGVALKTTGKEMYHEEDNYYCIHNCSEKYLETMSGNYELCNEEEERCHGDDRIGQSSHPDTYDRNPSSVGDTEFLDKAAGDDEITTQEPLGTDYVDKGHLHPETSDKNSCKENTPLLLNNYDNTMMICQPKADTDYFSNSTLEGDVANSFLDDEQLACNAVELNLKHSLQRSVKDEDKETKDCIGTNVKVNFESKDNMPTSTDLNDALTEVCLVKDSNAGCTTEHVSKDGYKLGKQDVNLTTFLSEAEEDSLQDQLSASKTNTNMQATTIASADVDNMSLNNREPNLQDKSKETLDYTTNTDVNILIDSCEKMATNNVKNDADISFCAGMSTAQDTEQPATFAGVSDHEDVCIHGNNFVTERQIVSTSPESRVSVINSTTTLGATALESRSKFELDPPVADSNLATETFHDQAQLTDIAEVYKPSEGKVVDSQTDNTNTGAHVLSKGIDNKGMIGNPTSAVAQTYSFTIVKESDEGDTIERSSDDRKELKIVDAYGSQFGTELEESSTQYASFQVDTHTNNRVEGCSYSATNIYVDETNVKQTMLDRDNGQIRLNDEHFDNRPILSRSAVIESLDVITVQPPARTDNQGKPDTSIDNNDNNDDRRETKSLLQEAIECLAESNLIYLLADLRLQ
jgi:hypothetical protein